MLFMYNVFLQLGLFFVLLLIFPVLYAVMYCCIVAYACTRVH